MERAAGSTLLGLALAVSALLFGAGALAVPAIAFALLGVGAAVWVACAARAVTVARRLELRRVLEGERVGALITLRRGRLPLPGGELDDPLAGAPLALPRDRNPGPIRLERTFAQRGLHELEPPRAVIRDPLGLASWTVSGGAADQLLVLPRIEPVAAAFAGGEAPAARSALVAALASTEVDGLRPYRDGTPAARIHWPALARGAGLLERHLRADADLRPLVVLDSRDAVDPADLDAAVRAAASLTRALARAGGCALLIGGERRAALVEGESGAWAAAHVRLALVDGSERAPGPALVASGPRRGPLIYVAAARRDRLPAAVGRIAAGARFLVVPGGAGAGRPLFSVAGCCGYAVASRRPRAAAA